MLVSAHVDPEGRYHRITKRHRPSALALDQVKASNKVSPAVVVEPAGGCRVIGEVVGGVGVTGAGGGD